MKINVKPGQSQLLIPLLIIITSAVVFAANTTIGLLNATLNDSNLGITGNLLQTSRQTQIESFPIEVWANTVLTLEPHENTIRATLTLDNGTLLGDQQIDFYLNETFLYSGLTNSEGFVDFTIFDTGVIKAVFNGNQSLFFSASESEIKNVNVIENVTLNETKVLPNLEVKVEETQKIGDLEITLESYSRDNYTDWDYDTHEEAEKNYYKFYVKVFNNFSKPSGIYSFEDRTVFTSIKLVDDLGNEYKPISARKISFDIQDFGKDMSIHPQTIREGYLFFSEIDRKANELSLVFETEKGKAAFNSEVLIK